MGSKFHHFSPVDGIQQTPTAGPTAVTNRTSRGSSSDGSTAVASVCVHKDSAGCDWLRFYTCNSVYRVGLRLGHF
jgi:hypothetical protein